MKIEVEQKFAVDDPGRLRERLSALGARWQPPVSQRDTYFTHPARDFAATDEALRIRRTPGGAAITYKGPRLDAATKTRRELELPLGPRAGLAEEFTELLCALGFRPLADVSKNRVTAIVPWRDRSVEVSLDEVAGLGSFVELEQVVAKGELEPARAAVAALAEALGLTGSERRSYLELLLARRGLTPAQSDTAR